VGFFGWVFLGGFFIANPACRLVSSASRLAAARVWSSSCASMLAFAATFYDADKNTTSPTAVSIKSKMRTAIINLALLNPSELRSNKIDRKKTFNIYAFVLT
jgi:hypothetical protein